MEVGPEEQMGNRDSHSPTVVQLKGGGGGGGGVFDKQQLNVGGYNK